MVLQKRKAAAAQAEAERAKKEAEDKAKAAERAKVDAEAAKKRQEEEMMLYQQKLATPVAIHVQEGATDDQEEGQMTGTTDLSLEGVAGLGSELERVHIAERNKAMAAKLKVRKNY